jgi:transposase InsO family protein
MMCDLLGVSPSGYHADSQRQRDPTDPRRNVISNDALLANMRAIHAEAKQEYGWPRMHKELVLRDIRVGRERVRKLMQQHGIRARHKRKWIATTNSNHALPVAPNLIERNFTAAGPNQVWTTDITYVATDEGWQYLVAFLDLFSRQIVGWSMQAHMRSDMVTDALRMAYFKRRPEPGLIVHSDRGSQFCSAMFQDALKAYGMRSSMSRKGDCWDNAPTESLWSSLKTARIHGKVFKTGREAKDEVIDWINFYNAKRLHSTLGYVSPNNFEKSWRESKIRIAA